MYQSHPQIADAQGELAQFCAELATTPGRGRTVVLFGENGSGKTRLAQAVSRWFQSNALKMPWVVRDDLEGQSGIPNRMFAQWPAVVDNFKRAQDFAIISELMTCSLLVVDDIGAEHDPSGFGREQLYLLLSRREFRWNLITTNFAPKEWHTKFERRIASRLFRNATHIDFSMVPDFSV